ncbi:SDR family oxidoreductase [Nocardiopsis sp. NPDC055551]|uniref:SDR family oxidoreductase n=1 Tax=Nocardiopsis sp. NPDC006832 TaxID=3157188 RepID=UPI0033F7F782
MVGAYTGRSVLVTGGAGGIGAALVRRAASDGARVVIADVDTEAGAALAEEVGARFQRTDVRDFEQVRTVVDLATNEHGGLDVLHLNAGITGPSESFTDMGVPYSLEHYRQAVGVNLDGVVHGVHAALPSMRHRTGASIIVTVSFAGLSHSPHTEVYSATKHAALALVRSLSMTFADDPVTFNALCPGFVDTPLLDPVREHLPNMDMGALGNRVSSAESIADLAERIIAEGGDGDAWIVSADVVPTRYPFEAERELLEGTLRAAARR